MEPEVNPDDIDNIPSDNAGYGVPSFWDEYYSRSDHSYDWYQPYPSFRKMITRIAQSNSKILIPGCGNSLMMEDMINDGFSDVTGLDISRVVIDQMKEKYSDIPLLSWIQGNICHTEIPADTYDVIIDKGLHDSLLCTIDNVDRNINDYFTEIQRMLTRAGVFICISYVRPDMMLDQIDIDDIEDRNFRTWDVDVEMIEKPKEGGAANEREEQDDLDPRNMYFIYICRRNIDRIRGLRKRTEKEEKLKKKKKLKQGENEL